MPVYYLSIQRHADNLWSLLRGLVFFFFQAEDGIRDSSVTGVQTCALPISIPAQASPILNNFSSPFNQVRKHLAWGCIFLVPSCALFRVTSSTNRSRRDVVLPLYSHLRPSNSQKSRGPHNGEDPSVAARRSHPLSSNAQPPAGNGAGLSSGGAFFRQS